MRLNLPEELILMLLNQVTGYFHQVPGWNLNCAMIGAVLAELSLVSRIDTDMKSVILLDRTALGDPAIDPILEEIADEPLQRSAQYWIERLAPRADSIIDSTLKRLVDLNILDHHEGDFWTVSQAVGHMGATTGDGDGSALEFVTARIAKVIVHHEIPTPRDVIIIGLLRTCDVVRFLFKLDNELEKRVKAVSQLELIGRSIADAVASNLAGPLLRRSTLVKKIPAVPLRKVLFNPHVRDGNLPAIFANLASQYGPVFELRPPFKPPMTFLAGLETNRWVQHHGRMHLRAKDYFSEFEKVYGANGVLPSLDGAEHFRLRKALAPAYSRARLEGQLDRLYRHAREYMANWTVGDVFPAIRLCRRMINAQISPLSMGVDTQDIIDDLIIYKERALNVHIIKALPGFMLHTPGMKRRAKAVDTLVERVQNVHTSAQRADAARDLADDLLSLHASDPQFVPESNLRFALSAALIASVYLGDALSFTLYALATQPDIGARIRSEADALFDNGDPESGDFNPSTIDVTHRFIMECLRMYPIVPMSIRNIMNTCVVEGHELPVGRQIFVAQAATHFMNDVFPDPFAFDIDRYLPPRSEHHSPGYAPFGLGTHTCLGSRWLELQLVVNLLMVAHHFAIEVAPADYKLRFNPIPSMSPSKKLSFRIAEQRRAIRA